MREKRKGFLINLLLYVLALGTGLIPFAYINDLFLAEAALTVTATLLIYIVTCFIPDTSLYDPYWSVAPPVMLLAAMMKYDLWSANAILMLACVFLWAVRLTVNWAITYKGLCREDWRYSMFREKYGKFVFAIINLFGLQFVPTIVVYAGLVGAFFVLQSDGFTPAIVIGLAVMLAGVALELISDTAIHRFLKEDNHSGHSCNVSVWKYSRHPNYLGEMTVWVGVFLAYVAVRPEIWYYGLGFILIVVLFLFVSIPMMEKHNEERRTDYLEYKKKTSVLLPMPQKNHWTEGSKQETECGGHGQEDL